jgi:copper homeostasis protein (lipoprotein)
MRIARFLFLCLFPLLPVACNDAQESTGSRYVRTGSGENTRVSGSYAGVYRGVVPCGQGRRMILEITLTEDQRYRKNSRYFDAREPEIRSSGHFHWNDAGNIVVLETGEGPRQYLVADTALFQLDMMGNQISPAGDYILRRSKP